MNREVFIMRLATQKVPLKEAEKHFLNDYERTIYMQSIEMLEKAKREGRQIMLYTPND